MRLQQQIAEAIIIAFEELGGDPQRAIDAAMRHSSVDKWISQETARIAAAGGAEMIIPGLHALTIPAGISYLLHRMAAISWGVGALKGAYVVETPDYSDLRNILALWANGGYFNAHVIDHLAVSVDVFTHVLTEDGQAELQQGLDRARAEQRDNALIGTLRVLEAIAIQYGGDERSQRMLRVLAGSEAADAALLGARERWPGAPAPDIERPLNRRISARLAGRLAAQISMRVPARMVVGFVPIAGAVVNAFFNAQTLRSMAQSAEIYYDRQFRPKDLAGLLKPAED